VQGIRNKTGEIIEGLEELRQWAQEDVETSYNLLNNNNNNIQPIRFCVNGTSRCLFSDKYKVYKYSVGRTYSC
jgi:hypothetical protein